MTCDPLQLFEGERLEKMQAEAIDLGERLRRMRHELGLINPDELAKETQCFHKCVWDSRELIGRERATRILRHSCPAIRGHDANKSRDSDLEQSIRWAEIVLQNIDHELDVIDRRRTLALTVVSVVAATAAAIASVISVMAINKQ